uniref:Piezo-type mechanosensitive ion channel component n=1 Tax=Panagrolaimus sp. PS1159 TaxID=55785 RepID=A0AC35FYR8_9BILA
MLLAARTTWQQLRQIMRDFAEILWRLAEVHLPKLVLLILIITASSHICVLNFVLVFFVSLAVCLPALSGLISLLLTVYLALSTVTRVVYLIHFQNFNSTNLFDSDVKAEDCDIRLDLNNGSALTPLSSWIGFEFTDAVFEKDIIGLVIVMVVIAIQISVRYRQRHIRRLRAQEEPADGLIFPYADPRHYDRSLLDCLMFFFNYGFYKFGLEISMIMMAIVSWTRMDFLGCIIIVWLFMFALLPRRAIRVLWPIFLLYLAIVLPLQYAMWVGLPEEMCMKYPWSDWLIPDPNRTTTILGDNLLKFLDLANYRHPPKHTTSLLVADFFLILIVASQELVFREERSSHPAGDNYSIYTSGDYTLRKNNPTYDFITDQKSFVDYFKVAIFMYGHWITLVMVLVAGLGGTSLFALGYLVLAFWMLWQGNNLYTMKDYRKTLSRWNFLLFYTIVVMFFKISLQVVGCVFLSPLNSGAGCVVRQLLSIICVDENSCKALATLNTKSDNCIVDVKETRIGFDTMALCFLVFQLRILHSWYFQHCMIDFRCEIIQASRGALLINQLIEKEMKEQNVQQQAKFDEIRSRTAAIRKQYEEQQLKGAQSTFQAQTYGQDSIRQPRPLSILDVDDPFPMYDPRHASVNIGVPAKRAGDYYMFNYEPDSDELIAPVESYVPEVTPGAGDFDKLDPAQLLHTAISKDMDLQGTLNAVETAEKIKDEELRMIRAVSATDDKKRDLVVAVLEPVENQPQSSQQILPTTESVKAEENDGLTNAFRFGGKIFRSFLDWLSAFLNRRSREHRYVAFVLHKEKTRLMNEMDHELFDENASLKEVRHQWESRSLHMVSSESDVSKLEEEAHIKWEQKSFLARLLLAVTNCVTAHTDVISYVIACIVHAKCAGLITLPLPMLVFFWGTLASPRPSKNFWITLISYTEFEIIVKFIFQFGFFPWNSNAEEAANAREYFKYQYVFGVQRVEYFAFWDVALLIALFFHRYMLRRLGLWKDANIMDTFIEASDVNRQAISTTEVDIADIESREIQATTQGSEANVTVLPDEQRGVVSSFVFKLFHPKFRYIRDLYPLMFFLDVFCFFIVVFGFSSFGDGGSGDVLSDLSSNRVPLTFVVMLIVISLMIVVDRGLYLRKAVLPKLIYQLVTVIFLHAYLMFILPAITHTSAYENTVAKFLYVVKCIYFVISAWQIRNGYPQLCIGNLLTHSYGLVNMVLFKIFMLIPFLFELRTAIDWTWTDTSMPILDFFSMENFYSTIYNLKCARTFETSFPAPRGIPKGIIVKYSIGVPLILALILIIWFPLLAFALLNKIGTELPPEKVQLSVSLEGYPRVFTMEAQGNEIQPINSFMKESLRTEISSKNNNVNVSDDSALLLSKSRRAVSYIEEYSSKEIHIVRFRPVSEVFWEISRDSLEALQSLLESERNFNNKSGSIRMNIDFAVQRQRAGSKEPVVHTTVFFVDVTPTSPPGAWEGLRKALNVSANENSEPVVFANVLPYFLTVPNEGQVKATDYIHEVFVNGREHANASYSSLTLALSSHDDTGHSNVWVTQTNPPNSDMKKIMNIFGRKRAVYTPDDHGRYYLDTVIFVDRVFPDYILKYAQGGIIAMYIALVLFISRIIRGAVTNQPLDVIISEIPNPDHLLKICLDIYLVREAHDFVLEQDLYAKLIFLFRSPSTLIKWTRYKPKQD